MYSYTSYIQNGDRGEDNRNENLSQECEVSASGRLEFASSCAEPVGSDTSCFSWRCCCCLCLCRCSFESACAGVAFVTRICATLCDLAGAWPERLRRAASAGGGVTASPLDSVPTLPLELCEPQRELPTVAGCTIAPCAPAQVTTHIC